METCAKAYKHQAVRAEDHKLQVFDFGGRLFGELMCTFGSGSSAGIYDNVAKVVKDLAIIMAKSDKRMVSQVLDDVVKCGMAGDGSVSRFYLAYREVAEKVGVSLAEESDVDKAFSATPCGKVLGVMYDLRRWVWWLSDDKLVPLILMLVKVRDSEVVENGFMMSLNGKLNHYMWLVPGGLWQRGFLLRLQDSKGGAGMNFMVFDLARLQAAWWVENIRAATVESRIPDMRSMSCMLPINVYTDAAGGAEGKLKNGVGGFCPPNDWFYMPWPRIIREGRSNSLGVKFSHKLCCLEGFGSLVGLVSIPDLARNAEVVIHCDNAGFVGVYLKKHSMPLCLHCGQGYS